MVNRVCRYGIAVLLALLAMTVTSAPNPRLPLLMLRDLKADVHFVSFTRYRDGKPQVFWAEDSDDPTLGVALDEVAAKVPGETVYHMIYTHPDGSGFRPVGLSHQINLPEFLMTSDSISISWFGNSVRTRDPIVSLKGCFISKDFTRDSLPPNHQRSTLSSQDSWNLCPLALSTR